MPKTKPKKSPDIRLRLLIRRQDADFSVGPPGKFTSGPMSFRSGISFYGPLTGAPKRKWTVGVVHIMPIGGMLQSSKPIEEFGHIDTKRNFLQARVFLPVEAFSFALPLVANQRFIEAAFTVSTAESLRRIVGFEVSTQERVITFEESMFWTGGTGPQSVPELYEHDPI